LDTAAHDNDYGISVNKEKKLATNTLGKQCPLYLSLTTWSTLFSVRAYKWLWCRGDDDIRCVRPTELPTSLNPTVASTREVYDVFTR